MFSNTSLAIHFDLLCLSYLFFLLITFNIPTQCVLGYFFPRSGCIGHVYKWRNARKHLWSVQNCVYVWDEFPCLLTLSDHLSRVFSLSLSLSIYTLRCLCPVLCILVLSSMNKSFGTWPINVLDCLLGFSLNAESILKELVRRSCFSLSLFFLVLITSPHTRVPIDCIPPLIGIFYFASPYHYYFS